MNRVGAFGRDDEAYQDRAPIEGVAIEEFAAPVPEFADRRIAGRFERVVRLIGALGRG